MAEIHRFDDVPDYMTLNQINLRVPVGLTPEPSVPINLIYLDRATNTVAIDARIEPDAPSETDDLNSLAAQSQPRDKQRKHPRQARQLIRETCILTGLLSSLVC
jgi:hypothetical protein